MRNTLFNIVIVFVSSAVFADEVCNVSFFNKKTFKIEEKTAGSDVEFEFGKEKLKVEGTCDNLRRLVVVESAGSFEIVAEHFEAGMVRQYVVKLCGDELGLIKVDRPTSKLDANYGQPRLLLTDPYGRILGEVANADNDMDSFVLRDSAGHILAHAKKGAGSWTVDSGSIHPLLASALLFASRMERNACELVADYWVWINGLLIGGIVGAVIVYQVALHKHWI